MKKHLIELALMILSAATPVVGQSNYWGHYATGTATQVIEALKAGATITERNSNGLTPLMCASMNNPSPEAITLLLNAGADARAKSSDGKNAFDYAQMNAAIKDTPAYEALRDATY